VVVALLQPQRLRLVGEVVVDLEVARRPLLQLRLLLLHKTFDYFAEMKV